MTWGTWESTGSATAVGILISAISLPRIILETLVGRVVDAFDRKKLMILAALGASLVSLALTLLTRESNGSTLFATVSFTWMLTVFNMLFHRARSSLLPRLISEHSILVSAQALLHITVSGMSVLSGGAALLIPVIGRVSIMAAGAAMAIAAALAAGQISHSDQGRSGVKAIRPSFGFRNLLGDPLDIVKSNRFLAWFIVFVALTNIPHRAMLAMVLPISAEKNRTRCSGIWRDSNRVEHWGHRRLSSRRPAVVPGQSCTLGYPGYWLQRTLCRADCPSVRDVNHSRLVCRLWAG